MSWEIVAWVCTAAALIGAWLNAEKRIEGFYVWIPANLGWMFYFGMHQQWASASLFSVYFALCILGIQNWRKDHE